MSASCGNGNPPVKGVAVVVMGDIARSPRMLNHARELVANGFAPLLIGYRAREFEPPAGVRVDALDGGKSAPRERSALLFAVTAGLRMSRLFFALLGTLLKEKPEAILVQNPPSFPTLLAATLAGKWLRAKVIVDWHNYGFSLLALRFGDRHLLVRLARWYEFRAGRGAGAHFCVSAAMRADLLRYGINAAVLYDRPLALRAHVCDAPRMIAVCPAGWTADEDIELLLAALRLLRDSAITVYITGEGMKKKTTRTPSCRRCAQAVSSSIQVSCQKAITGASSSAPILPGLSLHRSSSGLDLAMKVVDLVSASVPVCALDYGGSLLRNRSKKGVTGFLFRTAQDLANLLQRLASAPETLSPMRRAVGERWRESWHDAWQRTARPVLEAES